MTQNNWFKVGKSSTDSGLFFISDPSKTLHANNAMQVELGLNYNQFVEYLSMKEKLTGQRGFAQFNDNNGQSLGVAVQADPLKKDYDVWARMDDNGFIAEIRIAFDGTEPV